MMTLSLTLILGMLGLAVDVGWAYYRQQAAQAAADAAAIAAAKASVAASFSPACGGTVWCGAATNCPSTAPGTPSSSFDNACMLASANGFTTSGIDTVSVQAGTSNPLPTVSGPAAKYWAVVRVNEALPALFGAAFARGGLGPGAIATAAAQCGGGAGTCSSTSMYALDAGNNSFVASGGSTSVIASGGVYTNGQMVVSGGASLNTTPGTAEYCASLQTDNNITPAPVQQCNANANLYASIPTPTINTPVTCDQTNYKLNGGSATINPGIYCGGITNNSGTLNFNPGLYILYGGGLTSSGGSASLIGSGVTFYNTQGGSYNYSPIVISGGGNATLSAMTSGAQAGILFFEDPSCSWGGCGSSGKQNTISGGSSTLLSGGLYFKNDPLVFSGGSGVTTQTVTIVADTINFSGQSKVAPYAGAGAIGVPSVTLVQ